MSANIPQRRKADESRVRHNRDAVSGANAAFNCFPSEPEVLAGVSTSAVATGPAVPLSAVKAPPPSPPPPVAVAAMAAAKMATLKTGRSRSSSPTLTWTNPQSVTGDGSNISVAALRERFGGGIADIAAVQALDSANTRGRRARAHAGDERERRAAAADVRTHGGRETLVAAKPTTGSALPRPKIKRKPVGLRSSVSDRSTTRQTNRKLRALGAPEKRIMHDQAAGIRPVLTTQHSCNPNASGTSFPASPSKLEVPNHSTKKGQNGTLWSNTAESSRMSTIPAAGASPPLEHDHRAAPQTTPQTTPQRSIRPLVLPAMHNRPTTITYPPCPSSSSRSGGQQFCTDKAPAPVVNNSSAWLQEGEEVLRYSSPLYLSSSNTSNSSNSSSTQLSLGQATSCARPSGARAPPCATSDLPLSSLADAMVAGELASRRAAAAVPEESDGSSSKRHHRQRGQSLSSAFGRLKQQHSGGSGGSGGIIRALTTQVSMPTSMRGDSISSSGKQRLQMVRKAVTDGVVGVVGVGGQAAAVVGIGATERRAPSRRRRHAHNEGARRCWQDFISDPERRRYEGLWASNKGLLTEYLPPQPQTTQPPANSDGHGEDGPNGCADSHKAQDDPGECVLNIVVRDLWRRSRLPDHELCDIWELVDPGGRGMLRRHEFVVGLWLIDQRLKGHKIPVHVQDTVWMSAI